MKKIKLTKVIIGILAISSVLIFNPLKASAFDGQAGQIYTAHSHSFYANGSQWVYENGFWICGTDVQPFANAWINTNGKWYYINPNGYMVRNVWVDNYYVDGSGAWIPNVTKDTSVTGASTATTTNNNTYYNNTDTNSINTSKGTPENNQWMKVFPCWVSIDGKDYYINKDMELEYNTTIDGYELGADGAWVEDDSVNEPKVTKVSSSIESLIRQAIQKQSYEAQVAQDRHEVKQEMIYTRQQKINELQVELKKLKSGVINDKTTLYIQQYEAKIEELKELNDKDSQY